MISETKGTNQGTEELTVKRMFLGEGKMVFSCVGGNIVILASTMFALVVILI